MSISKTMHFSMHEVVDFNNAVLFLLQVLLQRLYSPLTQEGINHP